MIWNMVRKLKIKVSNEKGTMQDLKYDKNIENLKNEKCTLQDLEYGENTENREILDIHTVGPGIWRETPGVWQEN